MKIKKKKKNWAPMWDHRTCQVMIGSPTQQDEVVHLSHKGFSHIIVSVITNMSNNRLIYSWTNYFCTYRCDTTSLIEWKQKNNKINHVNHVMISFSQPCYIISIYIKIICVKAYKCIITLRIHRQAEFIFKYLIKSQS